MRFLFDIVTQINAVLILCGFSILLHVQSYKLCFHFSRAPNVKVCEFGAAEPQGACEGSRVLRSSHCSCGHCRRPELGRQAPPSSPEQQQQRGEQWQQLRHAGAGLFAGHHSAGVGLQAPGRQKRSRGEGSSAGFRCGNDNALPALHLAKFKVIPLSTPLK